METPTSTSNFFPFTSTFPSTPPTSTSSSSKDSFIGNRPSTVLFFIALCVGISIAILFLFFTFRYFIRTRFGLYIPVPMYPRHPFALGPTPPPTMRPFVGVHQLFTPTYMGATRAGNIDPYNLMLRNRRAEGTYANLYKKRQLTREEVDQLFPMKTYAKWLAGGKEEVQNRTDGILAYGDDDALVTPEQQEDPNALISTISGREDGLETHTREADLKNHDSKGKAHVEEVDITELNTNDDEDAFANPSSSSAHDELHFSSGTCAICLEDFEDDDNVRGLLCGHCFHHDCVETWLINRRASCPICKRDYYMKDRDDDGSADGISSIFGATLADNVFFPRTTKFRAIALLAALYEVRNGRYNQDNTNTNNNADEGSSSEAPAASTAAITYDDINPDDYQLTQRLPENYPPIPAMPPLESLDAEIRTIVDRRPFNPEDLKDLDYISHLQSVKLTPWFSKLFWVLMGVTRRDIFYHFVVVEFQDRRLHRLNRARAASRNNETAATSPYPSSSSHRSQSDIDLNSRRMQVEVMV